MNETISGWRERFARALRQPRAGQWVVLVLVPALLVLSLFLPPVKLGVRLWHLDYPLITPQGGGVGQDGGARLTIPAGALEGNLRLRLTTVDLDDQQAAQAEAAILKALPATLERRGALYRFRAYGSQPKQAIFTVPLPAGVTNFDALDLYAWTGKAWQWVPSKVRAEDGQLEATLTGVPPALAIMETKAQGLGVGIDAPDMAAVNGAPLDLASELYVAGLALSGDGTVSGQVMLESAPPSLLVLPSLSNRVQGVVRTDWVANLIANPDPRRAHVKAILEAVDKAGYKGLSLEYAGVDASLRAEFSDFVSQLASGLHKAGKVLAVRVDEPVLNADGTWATAGYDWQQLGQMADILRVPALSEPTAYGPSGAMEECLRALVQQADRQKVELIVDADSLEQVGSERHALCYGDALSLASQALTAEGGNLVLPGKTLAVSMPSLTSGTADEAPGGNVTFSFKDKAGVEHKVWVEDANSVARKLELAGQFCLRAVAIDQLAGTANDAHIWDTVRLARVPSSSRGGQRPASNVRYTVVWKVASKDGQVIQQGTNPADQPGFTWTAVNDPGEYVLSVALSDDGGKTTVGQPGALEVIVPTPTPSPTPSPTPTARPKPAAPAASAGAATAPLPSSGVGFGYGIQVDMVTDTNYDRILSHVQALGIGWIKQQVEWKLWNPAPGQYDWGRLDAIVDACSARGLKILFSVVKAPNWARPAGDDRSVAGPPADPNTYAEFVRQMAARYKGRVQAYEIWNEQNLWYEWGGQGGRLNAAAYVQLLKAAYVAIKSADPGATVISGALTPTGVDDGNIAIEDQKYLRQMYAAGLKNYCDAVGVHPSGYNNPPDADWRSWSDPTTGRCKGHPSWFFRGTIEGYRNTMVANGDGGKRLWPTEFGWASVDGFGVAPARGYEYAADNTADEQAQFIVRAYQMGRNWGFIGPMFLWNLNFAPLCGPGDEKAAFSIVNPGWGARPAFNALAGMPK